MRKNPYLRQEQVFTPLLMRGSLGNDFLITNEQVKEDIAVLGEAQKKTYTSDRASFDMVQSTTLNRDGRMAFVKEAIEMCTTECPRGLFSGLMGYGSAKVKFDFASYKSDSMVELVKSLNKRPIDNVTWFDCIVFCNKLSEVFGYAPYYAVTNIRTLGYGDNPRSIENAEVNIIGGNGFRLPTAEEWLIFAKAGTNNRWSGTDIEGEVGEYAWYHKNSNNETHPVATKKPNEWGMYDMTGNVSEWVWDKRATKNANTMADRGVCGIGFLDLLHPTHRMSHESPSSGNRTKGFRFARTIEQK